MFSFCVGTTVLVRPSSRHLCDRLSPDPVYGPLYVYYSVEEDVALGEGGGVAAAARVFSNTNSPKSAPIDLERWQGDNNVRNCS